MLAVGIGRGIKDTELKILAGEKGDNLHPASFNQLFDILGKLKDAACGKVFVFLLILSCNVIQKMIKTFNTLNHLKITLQ